MENKQDNKAEALERALNEIRAKFGENALPNSTKKAPSLTTQSVKPATAQVQNHKNNEVINKKKRRNAWWEDECQNNRKDFGADWETSALLEILPQAGMHTIKLIVGSDLTTIEALLEVGVSSRDLPLHRVDFAKGLVQFQSRFIRGTVSIDEVTNTYSDQKQPWLKGDGVYLFKNIEPILEQTNLLVEFFRGLYALRKGEIDKTLFTDGTLIKNNISMCIICNDEQFKKLIAAHNKLRANFQLATLVDMAI